MGSDFGNRRSGPYTWDGEATAILLTKSTVTGLPDRWIRDSGRDGNNSRDRVEYFYSIRFCVVGPRNETGHGTDDALVVVLQNIWSPSFVTLL